MNPSSEGLLQIGGQDTEHRYLDFECVEESTSSILDHCTERDPLELTEPHLLITPGIVVMRSLIVTHLYEN